MQQVGRVVGGDHRGRQLVGRTVKLTWRVMISCREKGSSVSKSRKFLALMFNCSTA